MLICGYRRVGATGHNGPAVPYGDYRGGAVGPLGVSTGVGTGCEPGPSPVITPNVVIVKGITVYNDFYIPFLCMPSQDLGVISTSLFRFRLHPRGDQVRCRRGRRRRAPPPYADSAATSTGVTCSTCHGRAP